MKKKTLQVRRQPRVLTRGELEQKIEFKKIEIYNYKELMKLYPGSTLRKPAYLAKLNGELSTFKKLLKDLPE